MKRYYFICLMFSLGFFNSCVTEFEPEYISSEVQNIVVLAELEVGEERPLITLTSTFVDSSSNAFLSPDVFVDVFEGVDPDPISFRRENEEPSLWKAPAELDVKVGDEYKIIIDGRQFGLELAEAYTKVFEPGQIENIQLSEPRLEGLGENIRTVYDVDLSILELDDEADHYHLVAYYNDNDGNQKFLDLDRITSGQNAIVDLTHRYGMLIDYSVLGSENDLQFTLSTSDNLENTSLNDPYLYFKLCTVSEDYFKYHEAISQQNQTNLSPFTLPTLTFTNIENGYGLFVAFSSATEAIEIQ